jgi:hypothetical protein
MSNLTKNNDKNASAAREAFKRDRKKALLDQRIGVSVLRGIEPTIERFLFLSIVDKPTVIRRVSFHPSAVRLEIDWPFRLPEPTGDPSDWLPTPTAVARFREELKLYLLEQRDGARFANLLHQEYVGFLRRFFRLARFEPLSVGKNRTVGDHLDVLGIQAVERRLAGPRKAVIPDRRAKQMRREGCGIIGVLERIRKTYSMPVGEITKLTEKTLLKRLESEYRTDRYPWMKHFRRGFELLKPTKTWKQEHPLLAVPASWAIKELAVQILQQKYLLEAGADYPLGVISEIVQCGSHSRN